MAVRFMSIRTRIFALAVLALMLSSCAQNKAYLLHGADPLQRVYTTALLGFAFENKCGLLTGPNRSEYGDLLESFTSVFRGHLQESGYATSHAKAVQYAEEMAWGAIKYVSTQSCDGAAKEAVDRGLKAVRGIDQELKDLTTRSSRQ